MKVDKLQLAALGLSVLTTIISLASGMVEKKQAETTVNKMIDEALKRKFGES